VKVFDGFGGLGSPFWVGPQAANTTVADSAATDTRILRFETSMEALPE
jgi:hypothetical protein